MKSNEDNSVSKTIWDNSIHQYVRDDFKIYWETLSRIGQYQYRCMTGDESVDYFSYTMNYVKEHIGNKNLRALSIGCMEGNPGPEMTLFETGMYSKIEVMDIAQGLLKKQSRIAAEKGLNAIEYIKQDLNCVELEKDVYDFIWAVGTVHHVENLELFFEQVHNALKDNGIFMMREYIGPNRIQFTEEQLSIVNEILSILPEKYKKTPNGFIKNIQEPTDVAGLIKIDPSESVRSEDIMQIVNDKLEIVKLAYTGGTILQPLLFNIASNFEKDQEGNTILKLLILLEKTLIEKGAFPSDYVFCMARKKGGLIARSPDTANVGSHKANTMNLKACSKGLETIIKEKDAHIHNIETELNLIKQSKAWRIAECFRRLFYIKLLGKFPLLQKAVLTVKKEGFRQFLLKTKSYLRSNKNAAVSKTIWDNSIDQYVRDNFKVYWETLSTVSQYQYRCITGDEGVDYFSYTVNYLKEYIGDKNLRALSIGCMEGNPGAEMSLFETGMFSRIEVMDIAQGLLKKQSRNASERGLNAIEYIKQDLNCVELEKNVYDFIWAIGTVHHVENLELFFEQVQNALKDNGIFIMREYIGPNRINHTEEQLSIVNEILSILPEKYKKTPQGFIKNIQEPTDVAMLIKNDPSEAARSQDILPILEEHLEIVKLDFTGGTILQPLLFNIASNFEKDQEGDTILKLLILLEKTLVEKGALPSDYVFCIARKKDGLITQTQDTVNVGSNKDSAMNLKACSKGLETIIKEKDAHIHNIEAELNLIKQSKAWRMAESLRRMFYVKLLGHFTR